MSEIIKMRYKYHFRNVYLFSRLHEFFFAAEFMGDVL